ncbi:MAG: hypothetical protein L7U72_15720, partial [Rubripirellula sp.]|nr:hypothetical protein [Rubripirellula sp.]
YLLLEEKVVMCLGKSLFLRTRLGSSCSFLPPAHYRPRRIRLGFFVGVKINKYEYDSGGHTSWS